MENNKSPKKTFKIIKEEKILCRLCGNPRSNPKRVLTKPLHLDLQIQPSANNKRSSQKVILSIKQRLPVIRTLFLAEKSRFASKKASSGSRLALGDHSSFTTHFSDGFPNSNGRKLDQESKEVNYTVRDDLEKSSLSGPLCFQRELTPNSSNADDESLESEEKCFIPAPSNFHINYSKTNERNKIFKDAATVNLAAIGVNYLQQDNITLQSLTNRIHSLEQQVKQILIIRSMDSKIDQSSSNEETKRKDQRKTSPSSRAGCSYIQQYSHIPDTSAFQRYPHQAAPLSPSKATTIEKEHNSEQYGRDFTAYDGITARGRRQCASVPCKRDDMPKMATERVNKVRHKLNPVRDYRLMDTVHYLAQGEFAPREDGIKLTPSREAVLSDIIWEDVCRTHWPSTRLGRRQPERCSTRYELQKLIDNLLRERVAHVERRRKRHYRIVKLNHRHESSRPMGKTGDIIVASHKNRQNSDERELAESEHNPSWRAQSTYKQRSHDRFVSDSRQKQRSHTTDSSPGPSKVTRCANGRKPTICYQTTSPSKIEGYPDLIPKFQDLGKYMTSGSSSSNHKRLKQPRLVVKKISSSRKRKISDEPDLEHFILLPTLVVRTPSNVRRQKKFNELYHRILKTRNNNSGLESSSVVVDSDSKTDTAMRDVGLNINITLSESEEHLNKKR